MDDSKSLVGTVIRFEESGNIALVLDDRDGLLVKYLQHARSLEDPVVHLMKPCPFVVFEGLQEWLIENL